MQRARSPVWIDGVVALVLVAATAAGLATTAGSDVGTTPTARVVVWALSIAACLCLALRARAPIFAGLGAVILLAIAWLLAANPNAGPLASFLALILAFAWIGGADPAAAVPAGLVGAAAFLAAGVARQSLDGRGTIRVGAYVVFLVAWLVGREVRRRRLELARLRAHAARLEQERDARERAVVADERARIARELHDVVAHSVSVMVVQSQAGQRLERNVPAMVEALQSIETVGRDALGELRRLLGILRQGEGDLDTGPQPGLGSMASLIDQTRRAGIDVTATVEGEPLSLPPGVDLAVYRIVQEALTNVLRHAEATRATVALRREAATITIEVADDGRGFDPARGKLGHGLVGIRERAALYGGDVVLEPATAGGLALRATIPIGNPR